MACIACCSQGQCSFNKNHVKTSCKKWLRLLPSPCCISNGDGVQRHGSCFYQAPDCEMALIILGFQCSPAHTPLALTSLCSSTGGDGEKQQSAVPHLLGLGGLGPDPSCLNTTPCGLVFAFHSIMQHLMTRQVHTLGRFVTSHDNQTARGPVHSLARCSSRG